MRSIKKFIILLIPMLLLFSQSALAKGNWHDFLAGIIANNAPSWLIDIIVCLHGFLCCYGG
jgi:hypothetical protein